MKRNDNKSSGSGITISGNANVTATNIIAGQGAKLINVHHEKPDSSPPASHYLRHRIMLSYRRDDSRDTTGRIYDRLKTHFDERTVFRDIDSIPPGTSYPDRLEEVLREVDVVLVIVGPGWITAANKDGSPRLFDASDYVRREIEIALHYGIPIVPLTVAGAKKPSADALPDSIKPLATRQGFSIRPEPDFHHDMDELIRRLEEIAPNTASAKSTDTPSDREAR